MIEGCDSKKWNRICTRRYPAPRVVAARAPQHPSPARSMHREDSRVRPSSPSWALLPMSSSPPPIPIASTSSSRSRSYSNNAVSMNLSNDRKKTVISSREHPVPPQQPSPSHRSQSERWFLSPTSMLQTPPRPPPLRRRPNLRKQQKRRPRRPHPIAQPKRPRSDPPGRPAPRPNDPARTPKTVLFNAKSARANATVARENDQGKAQELKK